MGRFHSCALAFVFVAALATACSSGGREEDCSNPPSDEEFCSQKGYECGELSADTCGETRTVPDCGSCSDGLSCNGGRCCAAGFTGNGESCVDIDECATNNGGCDANATCTNTDGSRTCACKAGFGGNGELCHAAETTTIAQTYFSGYSGPAFTCEAKCVAAGHLSCSTECSPGTMKATYSRTSNGVMTTSQVNVTTCDQSIEPEHDDILYTYELYRYVCCCLTTQRIVDGDVKSPKSCNDVCEAEGMECNEAGDWSEGTKGGRVTYRKSSSESRMSLVTCDAVPPVTAPAGGGTLVKHECACK